MNFKFGLFVIILPREQNINIWQGSCAVCKEISGQGAEKKDKDRREGKGRRCCLEERIDSIPCCANCFALGQF